MNEIEIMSILKNSKKPITFKRLNRDVEVYYMLGIYYIHYIGLVVLETTFKNIMNCLTAQSTNNIKLK